MSNVKLLLKEHLYIVDKENLLTKDSLLLIKDYEYVNNILGIKYNLNESIDTNIKIRIIEEQIIVESILSSINDYIGQAYTKGKEKTLEVIDSIKGLKDIAKLFKDILLDSSLMNVAINKITQVLTDTMQRIKQTANKILTSININISNFNEKFEALINHVESVTKNLVSDTGWKGFISCLGFTTLLVYVEEKFLNNMLQNTLKFIGDNINIVSNIADIFNGFKSLKSLVGNTLEIQPILSWFSEIGKGAALGVGLVAIDVIGIVNKVLTPIIKSVEWANKLKKPTQQIKTI
jgi:hypothetical protein